MVNPPLPWAACCCLAILSFCEDIFPDVQSKPPLLQLEAISSHRVGLLQDRIHEDGSFRAFHSDELYGYLIFNSVNIVF